LAGQDARVRACEKFKHSEFFVIVIGQQLARYEILSRISESPTGDVYKARDTETNRLVAIKALAPAVTGNPEQRRRIQEAVTAAAAISHPNLARTYELASADGQDFIVSELVEGDSLDVILRRERLHRRDLFSFARQIAASLEAAHAAGVIDGGLHDGCVVLDAQRRIKVLNYGLARALAIEGEELPLGIACYCSPEQVEGHELDERSDIFLFGSLLYYMTTRRRAFRRDTVSATLEAVLREEPKAIDAVTKHAPRGIEKIIKRCLRKSPDRRYQRIADLDGPLEKLAAEYEARSQFGGPSRLKRKDQVLPWAFAVAAIGAVAAGIVFWLQGLSYTSKQEEPTQITLDTGFDSEPAVSSSARQVAYTSDRSGEGNLDIWIQPVASKAPIRLTNDPADDHEPSLSADGSRVAFRSERDGGGIYVVQSSGGEARRLAARGRRPRFSPDGKWIAYWTGQVDGACQIFVIPSDGGEPRQIAPDFAGAYPVWSPDGNSVMFLGKKGATLSPSGADWWIAPLEEGQPRNIGGCRALRQHAVLRAEGCVPPGDWKGNRIYFALPDGAASNLWQAEIPLSRDITAKPVQITFGDSIQTQPSATDEGMVAFSRQSLNVDIWGVPIRANEGKLAGQWKKLTTDSSVDVYPSLSADGVKLLFQSNRRGSQNAWLLDMNSRIEAPVSTKRKGLMWPRISPDGSMISFAEEIDGKYDRFYMPLSMPLSGGEPEPLCQGCGPAMDWSRDGKRALIEDMPAGSIALVKPGSHDKTQLLQRTGSTLAEPRFSPDERWIAFVVRTEPANSRVWLAALRGDSAAPSSDWAPLTTGNAWEAAPQWSPDGKLVYFISDRDGQRCVWARRIEPSSAEPFPVYHFHDARRSPANTALRATDLFVGRDQMVIGIGELSGSIWMIDAR
jgi:eukaryotic-like serine/threonine-protein kinase